MLHRCQHDSKLALEEIVESGLSKGRFALRSQFRGFPSLGEALCIMSCLSHSLSVHIRDLKCAYS